MPEDFIPSSLSLPSSRSEHRAEGGGGRPSRAGELGEGRISPTVGPGAQSRAHGEGSWAALNLREEL